MMQIDPSGKITGEVIVMDWPKRIISKVPGEILRKASSRLGKG